MASELKPCPFCGSYNVRHLDVTIFESGHLVECRNCGAGLGRLTEAEAIEAWNTRAERTCRKVPGRMKYGRRMPACSECGYSLGDDRWRYCPKCGAKVVE